MLFRSGCCRKEEEDELSSFISENKLTVKHLLCTHLHLDHIFGNGFVHRTYGAEEEAIGQLEQIARNVGIAFQIQDDILDVTSTEDVLGKPIHSDEKNEKSTYVSFCGMEKAKEAVKEYSKRAMFGLEDLKVQGNKQYVRELIELLIHRDR